VRRDYEAAAAHFRDATRDGERRQIAEYLEIYALCVAQRCDEAHTRAEQSGIGSRGNKRDRGFSEFMQAALGQVFGAR
jgi:hypothetical protein